MDYPIQPLKRTSIISLFPTKSELEQLNKVVDPKTAPNPPPKSTIPKKSIKYRTDKKTSAKNRFMVNNLRKCSCIIISENFLEQFRVASSFVI
jgi:hypothetical protein